MTVSNQEHALLLYCRAGFEGECAAEIQDRAQAMGVSGYCRARSGDGYIVFHAYPTEDMADPTQWLHSHLPFETLIFTRQWCVVLAHCTGLPPGDRVGPLVAAAAALPAPPAALWLETPDTNEGKALSGLCRGLRGPLARALEHHWGVDLRAREKGTGDRDAGEKNSGAAGLRLHVCFTDGQSAWVGWSRLGPASHRQASPWPMGIPRLKFPHAAPSRSTLKLEEAFLVFLDATERAQWLRPGLTAVDLGAAPGGWTWQLVRHGVAVTAVDNGPMDAGLLASGLAEHRREDGFAYRPERPVNWLVCDIVDKPARVAARMADWLAAGWCERAVFNLKLPMKQRYRAVSENLAAIDARLAAAGRHYRLSAHQLYHDREEITVYARPAMQT